jgi:immune inhibitor A
MKRWVLRLFWAVMLLTAPAAAQEVSTCPTPDALAAAELPPRSRVDLAQRLSGLELVPATPTTAVTRQVGEQQTFTASNSVANETFEVTATLRAVGEHIYLWVENGAQVDDEDLRTLAAAFDNSIYKQVRDLWGSEAAPGIDGDLRIHGLFLHNLGPTTAAYFSSDHTYPDEVVPSSNEHEMFFFNLDIIANPMPQFDVQSIIAHEFQHMIRQNVQLNEDYWLNEGFSEFTQMFLFNAPAWETLLFLGQPNTQLNSWNEDLNARGQNYGAALLFVTYFYERYGEEGLRALSADPSTRGLQAVDHVLKARGEAGVDEFFADWVIANALNDPGLAGGRYGYSFLPWMTISASAVATIDRLPFEWTGEVNHYATDYFEVDVQGVDQITIALQGESNTARLIPTNAENGACFWYSNRGDMSDTTLTRAFDLTNATSATLQYRVWYHTEELWDYGYVMVSDDGGTTWEALSTPHTTNENPFGTGYGVGYTGMSGGWLDESVSLDNYAGKPILVRFEMITDDAITQPGMAIDDVRIPEIGYSDDFEGDGGGWEARGWLRTDNALPQSVWVQVVQVAGSDVKIARWLWPNDAAPYTVPVDSSSDRVILAISPLAPVTTVPMRYQLQLR